MEVKVTRPARSRLYGDPAILEWSETWQLTEGLCACLATALFHPLCAIIEMTLKLSTLAIVLGLGVGLPQIYGLIKPAAFAAAVRKFPRSLPWGLALMLLGTAWFLWNLSQESIADFAS